MGLFPERATARTVAEQLAHSGYDWLLVDTQHGPMGYEKTFRDAFRNFERWRKIHGPGGAGYDDRPGHSTRPSTWAPTAFSSPTSTPPKKRVRP